ncbi:uncharacterized protein LOC122019482 [Zingiber officinale]|uniref:uncharacterized protein LOC122019482 n=1 Tax=Zingiber officinale TaxID=94328 RepID=UPI001C4BE4C6|nr:uncharacterized protein LOC122019482 [Zingiber officinale]
MERGIEVNPSKVKALQDMPQPRNLKEAQRLTGRITALSRFISKSANRSLSFFNILRRATKFQWDEECDRVFEELKEYLNSLPRLKEWCEGYDIQQTFTSVAYPQSNGQAEVTNREIFRILRVWLDHVRGG